MIKLYKSNLIHVMCSTKILCDKRTMMFTMDEVMLNYRHLHNLGSHNVLL